MDRVMPILARLWPLVYIIGAFLIGVIVKQTLIERLVRFAARRSNALLAGVQSLRSVTLILSVLVGIYMATLAFEPPAETLDFIRKGILALALSCGAYVSGRTAFGLVRSYSHSAAGILPSTSLLSSVAQMMVFIVGALIVLGSLGISITPLLTALGVGGLAVALALKDPLSNLFAGLQIIASRQMRPGDYVKFDTGSEGTVVDITWNTTTIRDHEHNLIVIPNEKVVTSSFTNYDLPQPSAIIEVKAGIYADTDLDDAEHAILEVAAETLRPYQSKPELGPYVRFVELTGARIDFVVVLSIGRFADKFDVRHDFLKRLQARFRRDPQILPILSGFP
jgi:small-conductance mechanosensitive channel